MAYEEGRSRGHEVLVASRREGAGDLVADVLRHDAPTNEARAAGIDGPFAEIEFDFVLHEAGRVVDEYLSVPEQYGALPPGVDARVSAIEPQTFTLRDMPDRMDAVGDLWADMRRRKRSLTRAIASLKRSSNSIHALP